MAVSSNVIVEGEVVRIDVRTVQKKDKSGEIQFVNALIVGEHCLASVGIPQGMEPPKKGFKGRALVEVSTYNNDDQLRLIQWIG